MSYVFKLVPPAPDGNLRETALRDRNVGGFAPVDQKKEAVKLKIAKALAIKLPLIEVTRVGYEADDPSDLRCFEINDRADDSFGVQIELFDDEASITIPFWHTGEKATACFRQVWEVMSVVCSTGGYAAFDPQMDRPLSDGEATDDALACYLTAQRRVSRDPELGGRKPEKPKWWKKKHTGRR